MAYGVWPKELDHKNGKKNDDRLVNLREATSSQNKANTKRRSDNKSGFKGVCWNAKVKKWRATIKIGNKQKHLGLFRHPYDAWLAYARAAREYYGEFARFE